MNTQAKKDASIRSEHVVDLKLIPRAPLKVTQKLIKAGYEAYFVGGCIRDMQLGLVPKDFDVATSAHPHQIAKVFGRASRVIGRRFRIVHVYQDKECVEVTTFRAAMDASVAKAYQEGQNLGSRTFRKHNNRFGKLSDDAIRRDFTVNALYYNPVDNTLHDFVGGLEDIAHKRLRLIGNAKIRYQEDPVRMLRAARFRARFGFTIEPKSLVPIQSMAPLLSKIPAARLCGEVSKLFLTGHAVASLNTLREMNLLGYLFPELACIKNKQDWQLLARSLALVDRRIARDEPVDTRFLYMLLLWPLLQARLRKAGAPKRPLSEKTFKGVIADLLQQPDAKISTTARLRQALHEILLMQRQMTLHAPEKIKLSNVQQKLILQIADFLTLCGKAQSNRTLTDQGASWRATRGAQKVSVDAR